MKSQLLRTSVEHPLEARGKEILPATLNELVRIVSSKPFTENFVNSLILQCNAIMLIVDEAKDASKFLGDIGNILIEINTLLCSSDKLSPEEKDNITSYLMHAVDAVK